MTGVYEFADKKVRINSLYKKVHDYCIDYRTDGKEEITVTTTQTDIDNERARSEKSSAEQRDKIVEVSDEYLEELAVYRKIAEIMPYYNTMLFHGSVVAVDGKCYLFTAKSGTGKSTHTRLWRKLLGERAVMVNDDKPLIRVTDEGAVVFGTPYNGKHRLSNKISVPLRAVCILERSEKNRICRITRDEAYTMLIQQTYRPDDFDALARTFVLIDKMTDSAELWRMGCNMDISAAENAYNAMKG